MNDIYKFNQPIKRLLRDFENKKSGKVVESRREIRRRFDCLDRSHQVKFLMACFLSCKSDREWAYEEVSRHWDPRFKEVIANLWYNYHEDGATRCIVKHFPLEFVVQEIQGLDGRETYYDLCLRFCPYYKFEIDKDRLTPLQVLSLYTKTGYTVSETDLLEQLYRLLYIVAKDEYTLFEKIDRNALPCSREFSQCRKAFYFIMELQEYCVLGTWKEWDRNVQEVLCNKEEYHVVRNSAISDYDYNVQMSGLYKECLLRYLDLMNDFQHIRLKIQESINYQPIENMDKKTNTYEDEDAYNDFSYLNMNENIPF